MHWSHNFKQFTDITIDVQIISLEGPIDAESGLICRYQDDDNLYAFTYTAAGYYDIYRQLDGEFEILSNVGDYVESSAIRQGDAANQITASCIGDTLSLYINGEFLTEVTDTAFTSGDVGLIAGTFDILGTDVIFDDFMVYID